MDTLFQFFATLATLSSILVITNTNPVHSVLFLILAFFNTSGLLLTVGVDFFAIIFLVVYVGAIAVLFLFVVMMLNIKVSELTEKKLKYTPLALLVGGLFFAQILRILETNTIVPTRQDSLVYYEWINEVHTSLNINSIGNLLYTHNAFHFILSSLILLVAMIGAIVLTMHKQIDIKKQTVFIQNSREFGKTIQRYTCHN